MDTAPFKDLESRSEAFVDKILKNYDVNNPSLNAYLEKELNMPLTTFQFDKSKAIEATKQPKTKKALFGNLLFEKDGGKDTLNQEQQNKMVLIYMKWDYAVAAQIYSCHKYVF